MKANGQRWPAEKIERRPVAELVPYARNARTHSAAQVDAIAASIREWGWTNPVLVDEVGGVIAGHGRLLAAHKLGIDEVPCMVARGWTEAQKRAYVIADNQLALNADWDSDMLKLELGEIATLDFDLDLIGFNERELHKMLDPKPEDAIEDEIPAVPKKARTKLGQVWALDDHRIICGDATDPAVVKKLLPAKGVDLTLTDPPYGVGLDYESHDDTEAEVKRIAEAVVPLAIKNSKVVALTPGTNKIWHYPPSDWILCFHFGGQGCSKWGYSCWQPVLVYGKDPYLAKGAGSRPDAFNAGGMLPEPGLGHPCPKPVKVWAWIMERCGYRMKTVFDPFLGSGTTLVTAEQLGRTCYGIEIEPRYVDVCVKRWEKFTGRKAKLVPKARAKARA